MTKICQSILLNILIKKHLNYTCENSGVHLSAYSLQITLHNKAHFKPYKNKRCKNLSLTQIS